MQVILLPLSDMSNPTPLSKAKAAFSFTVHTFVEHLPPDTPQKPSSSTEFDKRMSVPTVVTYLVVGCRRKLVVYSWKDGEPQDVSEAVLPHSARTIAFLDDKVMSLSYSPTDHVLFSLDTMSTSEITIPPVASSSATTIGGMGMGSLSGFGGYMTLGLGAKDKPCVTNVRQGEVLLAKDNEGVFIGVDGKPTRPRRIDWPAPPQELAFVKPYVFSIFPPSTVPNRTTPDPTTAGHPSFIPAPVLEIRSSISVSSHQTMPFPFTDDASSSSTTTSHHVLRLLCPSPAAKSPLYLISTPTDRTAAASEGSTIWQFRMKSWAEQIDELVEGALYSDALALLDTIDPAVLPDKERRRSTVRALEAVSKFQSHDYSTALATFIELNINPAKVVALYPETIAGRLSVPKDEWISLFGGHAPKGTAKEEHASTHDDSSSDGQGESSETGHSRAQSPPSTGLASRFRNPLDAIRPSVNRDPETASITSKRRGGQVDNFSRSVESLIQYLPDRRQKVTGALETFKITPAQSHRHPSLSDTSIEDLFQIPNAPVSALTPEQLVRYAQVISTAMFKSYLIVRPGLVGSLCRAENWCEVSEVEEALIAREKYSELIDLYNGKKMHTKALDLLRKLSDKETDMADKLEPSIVYLQRLGPEHLDQIFRHSRWVLEQDPDRGFEIFTSEEVELPKEHVASFLEGIDRRLCARYLEFLIDDRREDSPEFHDRLAELYLKMTLDAKKTGNDATKDEIYDKLLHFIDSTSHFRVDRLFGLLPTEDLYEAKAILLGKLGRHSSALELYVYRLRDYAKAEQYCRRVYQSGTDTDKIFLTLLRIYLRPVVKTSDDLLTPALALIRQHNPRLDPEETLQLLPPLVSAQDVRAFLVEGLRSPIFDTKVVRDIAKARDEQVACRLMYLESNRVKVTDTRICPQCHKRIGHSVIAVHTPGGEVTHYQCREAFARKLKEMRHS
ncbi:vacuolar sorting protein 39 domain 1-domain-containing protein [Amylostereum chailletii]|nr:vacuolar sorting protein 39 domain 1-domain-containing protein [Amylostereum chailletii]